MAGMWAGGESLASARYMHVLMPALTSKLSGFIQYWVPVPRCLGNYLALLMGI